MAWTFTIDLALGGSQTGLTLRAALATGAVITVKDIATGFTERGAGLYSWTYASMPDAFQGDVVFYTGAIGAGTDFTGVVVKAGVGLNPGEVELPGKLGVPANGTMAADLAEIEVEVDALAGAADPLANPTSGYASGTAGSALNRIGTGQIQIASNLSATGQITVVRNSDNFAADGRSIDLPGPSANFWPNLTGATVALWFDNGLLSITGSPLTPTGNQVVRFEPTAAQTRRLAAGTHGYTAWATLADGHVVALAYGLAVVIESQQGP